MSQFYKNLPLDSGIAVEYSLTNFSGQGAERFGGFKVF